MHSRVFVLARNLEEIADNIDALDEVEIAAHIKADYAIKESTDKFKRSIEWLKNCYNLSYLNFKQLNIEEYGEITVAEIDRDELLKGLQQQKIERLKKVKEALEKEDLWEIAYWAYNQQGFYFYLKGYGLMNEVDLLESYKDINFENKIFIIRTFDYHF